MGPHDRCANCQHQRRTHRELYLKRKCWRTMLGNPGNVCQCAEFVEAH